MSQKKDFRNWHDYHNMSESINGIAAINRIKVIINPNDIKYQINKEYMIIIEFI